MNYIYHGVPEHMEGSEIIPLNQMRLLHPELQKKYLEKYLGREEILEREVPILNCLWNDVSQFLPLHPQKVFELQVKLGLIPTVPQYRFFKIDLSELDPNKAVVFFKTAVGGEDIEVKWLSDVDLNKIQKIPRATVDYYKTLVGTRELPFNYQFIPHLLYKGTVNISNSEIITL